MSRVVHSALFYELVAERTGFLRKHRLDYCERDKEAMVELLNSLRKLASL